MSIFDDSFEIFCAERQLAITRTLDLRERRVTLARQEASRRSNPPWRTYVAAWGVGHGISEGVRSFDDDVELRPLSRGNYK